MTTPLDNDLNKAYEAYEQDHERLRQTLMPSLPDRIKLRQPTGRMNHKRVFIGDTLMKSRITKFSAVAVIVIAAFVCLHVFDGSIKGSSVAFGEVLDTIARVQTLHARLVVDGEECEVWAKRPNRIRFDYANGKYEISNGPTMWTVDGPNNEATQKPSFYFKEAQRRGIDVLDGLIRMEYTDNFSGFFSEGPSGQIEMDNQTFDMYQMEFEDHGNKIRFEALVDSETHLIHLLKAEISESGEHSQSFELSILDYDQPIPDTMFVFEPDETMHVSVEASGDSELTPGRPGGSILSGRIIWASSHKPVSGARLTFSGGPSVKTPEGRNRSSFFVRTETDDDGYWHITGAPSGGIRISVRSWEFEWPAMPTFTTNVGSPLHPTVAVDGQSEYAGLNFKVYKPKDLYARITIDVKDEDGHPVEGASALLYYADESWRMHQHVYATPRKSQFSRADGRFDNSDIWPSVRPVKLSVGPRDADSPYPTRSTFTEPFIIEPKEHYHFDIVLPYKREMIVKVLNTEGRPMEGVSVSVLSQDALRIFPLARKESEILLTGSDGMADVTGMFPGENVLIALKRLDAQQPDVEKPLAFVCIPATAPTDRDKPIFEVVFDDGPITIRGRLDLDSVPDSALIYIMVTGKPGDFSAKVLRTKVGEDGKFLLQGVPAGRIRLAYSVRFGKQSIRDEGTITTEPGNRYTVKFTEQGLQFVDQQPNP